MSQSPEELCKRIARSRDKLFFIAYNVYDNVNVISPNRDGNPKQRWYLVRVDLKTCDRIEEARDYAASGKYYVEFYAKASYDQGFIVPGTKNDRGATSAGLTPKPDNNSRWWLAWHEYYFRNGEMIVGKAKEINPNSKQAISRRLSELTKRSNVDTSDSSDVETKTMLEYHPNLNRYTTWSDVVDLSDSKTNLLGPFDFDEVQAKHVDYIDLSMRNGISLHSIFVRDRVPLSRWLELLNTLKGSDIIPPSVDGSVEKKRHSMDSQKPKEKVKLSNCQICGNTKNEITILFPRTSTQTALCVHKSCAQIPSNNGQVLHSRNMIVSKTDILNLVEMTLKDSRNVTTAQGDTFYMFEDLRAHFAKNLEQLPKNFKKSPDILTGINEVAFPADQLESFPVLFSYHTEINDPEGTSEMQSKIALLDYEVEQRKEKRLARDESSAISKKMPSDKAAVVTSQSSKSIHKSATPKVSYLKTSSSNNVSSIIDTIPPEPAKDLPEGWTIHAFSSGTNKGKICRVYRSPKCGFEFQSKSDVLLFLKCLNEVHEEEKNNL